MPRVAPRHATAKMGVTVNLYDKIINKAAPILTPLLVQNARFFKPIYLFFVRRFELPLTAPLRIGGPPIL